MLCSHRRKVISPPVLREQWGCQPAQGRICLVHMDSPAPPTPPPIQQTPWLACLFSSGRRGQEEAQPAARCRVSARRPGFHCGDAVAASPGSPCLLQEPQPSWLIIPGPALTRGLPRRDNNMLAFHGQEESAEAVLRKQNCRSPRGN